MSNNPPAHSSHETIAAFTPGPGACDCHCHIFGRSDLYPSVLPAGYSRPVGPLDAYLEMAGRLGFERRVFVQPITYGDDNSCILDALRVLGPEATRGIGGIPQGNIADATLAEWHRLGLRGLRVNHTPYKPYEAGFADAVLPDIERAAALVRELGWVLDVMTPGWLTMELLPHLQRMRVTFTLGHFGKVPANYGLDHPVVKRLVAHIRDGEEGSWVKLCAAYQVSNEPDFGDVAPLARALYEVAPDRVIWGTDWPHIRHEEQSNTTTLFDLFGSWFPDDGDRQRILTTNPARLFGFAE